LLSGAFPAGPPPFAVNKSSCSARTSSQLCSRPRILLAASQLPIGVCGEHDNKFRDGLSEWLKKHVGSCQWERALLRRGGAILSLPIIYLLLLAGHLIDNLDSPVLYLLWFIVA